MRREEKKNELKNIDKRIQVPTSIPRMMGGGRRREEEREID
jgi:hypothetical protein